MQEIPADAADAVRTCSEPAHLIWIRSLAPEAAAAAGASCGARHESNTDTW
jgi:hypothetical protein